MTAEPRADGICSRLTILSNFASLTNFVLRTRNGEAVLWRGLMQAFMRELEDDGDVDDDAEWLNKL